MRSTASRRRYAASPSALDSTHVSRVTGKKIGPSEAISERLTKSNAPLATSTQTSPFWARALFWKSRVAASPSARSTSGVGPAGRSHHDMQIEVRIAVADPDAVDIGAIAAEVPYGTVTVTVVRGGLDVPSPGGDDAIVIANAAILVSFAD